METLPYVKLRQAKETTAWDKDKANIDQDPTLTHFYTIADSSTVSHCPWFHGTACFLLFYWVHLALDC